MVINLEVPGTTLTVKGASGVVNNEKSGGNGNIEKDVVFTRYLIRKTDQNLFRIKMKKRQSNSRAPPEFMYFKLKSEKPVPPVNRKQVIYLIQKNKNSTHDINIDLRDFYPEFAIDHSSLFW